MADEQPQTTAPAPSPAPAPASPVAPTPAKKKSNTGLIVVIVIVIVLGVLIGGGYMVYRYVKGKVTTAINGTTTTTSSDGTTTTTSSSLTDDYADSKDLTPADDFGKTVNADVKPILSSMYGGAKLGTVSSQTDGAALYYLTKNDNTSTDGQKISTDLQAKGYTQDSLTASSDSFMLYMKKGTTYLIISASGQHTVGVIASVTAATE